jgi:hypothetical protein
LKEQHRSEECPQEVLEEAREEARKETREEIEKEVDDLFEWVQRRVQQGRLEGDISQYVDDLRDCVNYVIRKQGLTSPRTRSTYRSSNFRG